jgi:hypothetical protein
MIREILLEWAPIEGTAQEAFFDDDTPDSALLFSGGWGSGKSTTLGAKMLKLSAINNPLPIVWIVPRYDHIIKVIMPLLTAQDRDGEFMFLRPGMFHYHKTDHILTWEGGGPIWFVSADRPETIAGPNVASAGVDEPALIDRDAWRNTVARVRHPRAKLRQTVAAGTPDDLAWMADLFFDPERPERYRFYRMDTRENSELLKDHPDYINQITENASDAEVAVFLEGKGVILNGAPAYPCFDEAEHWLEAVSGPDPNLPLRLAFDFNVNPMVCVISQIKTGRHGPELHVQDAIVLYGGSTVEETCTKFMDAYPRWPAGIVVYGDATGRSRNVKSLKSNYKIIEETLVDVGAIETKVPMSNPPVTERINAVNRLLKNAQGVTKLWMRKTLPAKRCQVREIVRSLQRSRKKDGTDDLDKPAGETITHGADALGYLVAAEFPVVKPAITVGSVRSEYWL